ncbi:gamma-glutamyl-gamma-aminobutyrate hydrolase family protein [Sunxiuqinia sp. A32]|uniref:gamma-glutamyl-gamma-aminobutyrate hydrolase family protein n=1 Tax=Sunxiuqinia sp. A32 TaxID=3461496 RepID=UPI00404587AA
MKGKLFFIQLLLAFCLFFTKNASSQNFFNSGYDPTKTYILLAHPTVENIERINYLIENQILFVGETEFIGVYFYAERYDYNQSIRFIRENEMEKFHLQRLTGTFTLENIFEENDFSSNFNVMFEQSKGIILFGGPDIQPEAYGEENTYSQVTDPDRHFFELSYIFHLLGGKQNPDFVPYLERNPRYFIIGFCLGMQTMNVATGGTMVQDIPIEIYNLKDTTEIVKLDQDRLHKNYWPEIFDSKQLMNGSFHRLKLDEDGFFRKEVKWKSSVSPPVLSSHHQAVENLNDCWDVVAWSMDNKVIEGIKHKKYPHVFGFQFHPELIELYENTDSLRFSPSDPLQTYHQRTGKQGVKFHKNIWRRITKTLD